jgi:hypothetical protein
MFCVRVEGCRVLREVFETDRQEKTGEWRNLRFVELDDMYSL